MPRKSSLCSRFILFYNNHRLKPHSQVGVIFLVPQYSLNILLSQQESGDKRLPFFLLHVSFLLHLLRMREPYLPCNHPVVERMYFFEDRLTHLHACSTIHVPSSPPSPAIHSRRFSCAAFLDCVLYLQVFFASRVCLHFLPLTACISSEPNSSERSTI